MACPCEHKAKGGKSCKAGTPPVLKVESVECPVLFHTVVIPASVGTVETLPPTPGAYRNARVTYEADEVSYLYDSDGIPQLLSNGGSSAVESVNGKTGEVVLDANDVGAATPTDINDLQEQIDALSVASDVTDVVGTYADLQAYDTSQLKDNDIIKVLQDEDQNDQTTYYRWDKETELFTLIGAEGPYYTKSAADTKFQDKLTAGSNITIDANNEISATDTTYSNFVGTDGVDAGAAGLVPAPATTDADKFLKSDGTWAEAGGGTLYTTYGQNEDGAMTQKATTDLVYTAGDPKKINIGDNGVTGGTNSIVIGSEDSGTITAATDQIIIGHNITCDKSDAIAIGHTAKVTAVDAVAIGNGAYASGGNYGGSVAVGRHANAYQGSLAIGGYTTTGSQNAIAICPGTSGRSAHAGQFDIAIGNVYVEGTRNIAIVPPDMNSNTISVPYVERSVLIGAGGALKSSYSVAISGKVENGTSYSVALGYGSNPRAQGVVDVTAVSAQGYQGANDQTRTNLRVISGVHDGEELNDAATVAQGNTLATSAPTATTVGVLGQLYTDTTAMHTYQCTAIDTTDPNNPVYTWTMRW